MNATQTERHLFCITTTFAIKEARSCAILSKVDSDLGYTTCVVEISNKSRNGVENGNYLRIGMCCFLKRYAMWKVLN